MQVHIERTHRSERNAACHLCSNSGDDEMKAVFKTEAVARLFMDRVDQLTINKASLEVEPNKNYTFWRYIVRW
jgi:hypothetical protein